MYNEGNYLTELEKYIQSTYGAHYGKTRTQTTDFVIQNGHGVGFCLGNVIKYAQRYGKKNGYNRDDLLKIIHYAMFALYNHDTNIAKEVNHGASTPTESSV